MNYDVVTKMCIRANTDGSHIAYLSLYKLRIIPRIVTPYQAEEFFPIETLPEIEAEVATKLASHTEGF